MQLIYEVFTWVVMQCYRLCGNYGVAIILFTILSKLILMPVSVWVQKNSIKMVKMQPDLNFITAKHYGDKDTIADEQSKLYKKEKYNPFASTIPMILQIVLLMGVIEAIKAGMQDPSVDMRFLGIDLSLVPSRDGLSVIWSPILAGLSAWLMCVAQDVSNVLQSEQSKKSQYGMMAFSVGLSLVLGYFVSVGVALYWIASNLLAIVQLYFLNWLINPKKYIDYERLEESKKQLAEIESIGTGKGKRSRDEIKREREDYKRFFSVVNKKLVFYSESNGFYKYFQGIIEYLLDHTNITIHYITSDPDDKIFDKAKQCPQIRAYYIGDKKLITLMMKMDADMVVMTMPDLETFHIKRSYIRKDVEYVYIPHGMDSLNLTMRTGSIDHYDTVFCTGKEQRREIEATERVNNLPKKKLVDWGYCLLDSMRADYQGQEHVKKAQPTVLIAPSWQKDNIVDNCLDALLDNLQATGYKIIVRPHPQHVRHQPEKMESLKAKYAQNPNIEIQTDFSSNSTVYEADMMITDWSGIAYEYAFTTCKPVIFVDTPMKVMNPEYEKIGIEPINIWIRNEIGTVLHMDEIDKAAQTVQNMVAHADEYHDRIDGFVNEYVYNLGSSAQVGAKYIISSLVEKSKNRKSE